MEPTTASRVNTPLRGVLIGSGAVASALAPALERGGKVEWHQVYSPNIDHAAFLAGRLLCARAVDSIDQVTVEADVYLVSVKDDAIPTIVKQFPHNDSVWMHTSGGVPAEALASLSPNYGVLYPLQTFSKGVDVSMDCVPLFVEGSNSRTSGLIRELAETVTKSVEYADSALRGRLHCAAVFACNFTNHLWAVADDILKVHPGLDITYLEPLLKETLRKAMTVAPKLAQTVRRVVETLR